MTWPSLPGAEGPRQAGAAPLQHLRPPLRHRAVRLRRATARGSGHVGGPRLPSQGAHRRVAAVERAVHPCLRTAPPRPPRTIWRLRPLLRTPERRVSSVEARRGPGRPPQAAPNMEGFPPPTTPGVAAAAAHRHRPLRAALVCQRRAARAARHQRLRAAAALPGRRDGAAAAALARRARRDGRTRDDGGPDHGWQQPGRRRPRRRHGRRHQRRGAKGGQGGRGLAHACHGGLPGRGRGGIQRRQAGAVARPPGGASAAGALRRPPRTSPDLA